MRIRGTLVAGLVLFATTGCMIHLDGFGSTNSKIWGQSVESKDGEFWVDGVRLRHERWVALDVAIEGNDRLEFATSTGPIALKGQAGNEARLEVHVFSEYENDGEIGFDKGRLDVDSERGKAFINAVRGTVPADLTLSASSGIGPIEISGIHGSGAQTFHVGTSLVDLYDVRGERIEIATGTGKVKIEKAEADRLTIESGTGDMRVSGSTFKTIRVDSGTADLELRDCDVDEVRFDSGTGDLILDGGRYGKLKTSFGTGDLEIEGGARIGA